MLNLRVMTVNDNILKTKVDPRRVIALFGDDDSHLNVGYPAIAAYKPVLGNMWGYKEANTKGLYIMVDTKVEQHTDKTIVDIASEMINKIPDEYKDRLIFQLYYPKQKEQMMKIYNFKEENLVLSLYKGYPLINDALKDAYDYHFSVILFNKKFFNDDELQRLINKNFVLVVYTVNKQNEKDKLLDKGITVTITDNLY